MRLKSLFIAVDPVGSKFAKALQQGCRAAVENKVFRVSRSGGVVKTRQGKNVFSVTNQPLNKIQQFQRFKENNVTCPDFYTQKEALAGTGKHVWFARTLINSTNGRGILEFDLREQPNIPNAPLYTEYIPKKAEYRVHVFNGEVIDIQQKKKKRGFEEERDTRIRNVANGYVYCRDGIVPPNGLSDLAVRAVAACGYLYGAVDIIYNERRNQCYVLEVNSRPGLMGTTLEKYVASLIKLFSLRVK